MCTIKNYLLEATHRHDLFHSAGLYDYCILAPIFFYFMHIFDSCIHDPNN